MSFFKFGIMRLALSVLISPVTKSLSMSIIITAALILSPKFYLRFHVYMQSVSGIDVVTSSNLTTDHLCLIVC